MADESEIKLCATDSIKGFLAWKKGKKEKKTAAVPSTYRNY
jgi:hypothetical protein